MMDRAAFIAMNLRKNRRYSAKRAAWQKAHPKVAVKDLPAPRELTIDELRK